MAKKRKIEMWQRKEVLRLNGELKRSLREIAQTLGIGKSTVGEIIAKAKKANLTWQEAQKLNEQDLENLLKSTDDETSKSEIPKPDFTYIHKELKRKGVTRHLLWFEYKEQYPEGYEYSQFCHYYKEWLNKCHVSMRQTHRAGEKTFVDYSGDKPSYTDPKTGKKIECELFVGALGASSFTYAQASPSQELPNWIECHNNMVEYFQGVSEIIIPDNLKSGVTKPCWYEPKLNRTYKDWSEHYNTAVIPARIRRPKDKAKVESAVRFAQTWILARLRNRQFFSISALNQAIWNLLEELNDKKMQGFDASRRELYLSIDKPALKPLPERRFEMTVWKKARVNIDYHVEFKKCFYSVPYSLVRQEVHVRATRRAIEIFHKGKRVASHGRLSRIGRASTISGHMPKEHQKYLKWSPSRIINWAEKTGPMTRELVEEILDAQRHPELGYRRCLGILRLGKKYGNDRLEAASRRALLTGAHSYRSVKNILKSGYDRKPIVEEKRHAQSSHGNIRGQGYYQ